jgi:DegV family protein with EDD domain
MIPSPRIAIVTDSTADIPDSLVAKYDLHVVPNLMIIDGQSLEDGKGISREEFYTRLPGMKSVPTTATASSGTYEQLYENLLTHGASEIVSVHASSALSGIYNAACLAASQFKNRIHVIDSEQVTLGLGFQVLAAAEAAAKGAPLEKILGAIQHIRPRARVVAMLDTLEYVRRSGRVSWARARLGNLLSIRPFVELRGGKVLSIGESRTRRKGIERLKELLINQGPLERLAILHTNAEADARQIFEDLKHLYPLLDQPPIVNITTIIGVHVGPNGLGFASIVKS